MRTLDQYVREQIALNPELEPLLEQARRDVEQMFPTPETLLKQKPWIDHLKQQFASLDHKD